MRRYKTRAFTLTEVMIAIAVMLLLTIGIGQVFRMTSETVGTGMAVSEGLRGMRGLSNALQSDFSGSDPAVGLTGIIESANQPAIIIRSQQTANPIPLSVTDNTASPRRTDTLSFFARGDFRRRTGTYLPSSGKQDVYVEDQASHEAWIWYGHVALPDNTWPNPNPRSSVLGGNFYAPGAAGPQQNPNNYYASSWTLGRVAILLTPRTAYPLPNGTLPPPQQSAVLPIALQDTTFLGTPRTYDFNPSAPLWMYPLAYDSPVRTVRWDSQSQAWVLADCPLSGDRIQYSTCDLADGKVGGSQSVDGLWRAIRVASDPSPLVNPYSRIFRDWWRPLAQIYSREMGAAGMKAEEAYRFNANPFVRKPLMNQSPPFAFQRVAQTTPGILSGCTQFIVEFAGDYLDQRRNPANPDAGMQLGPDGMLDTVGPAGSRQIRWYGLERDSHGTGRIDVMPVSTTLKRPAPLPFEQEIIANQRYTCAWGPLQLTPVTPDQLISAPNSPPSAYDTTYRYSPTEKNAIVGGTFKPQLIRITVQMVDAEGRLKDGLTQEYIFKVR